MNNKILPTQAQTMINDVKEEVQVYLQQELYYPALKAIDELFALNIIDNDLIYTKAKLYYLLGEYHNAYHWLRVFSDNQGPDYRSYLLNCEIQIKSGHKEEAIKILSSFFQDYAYQRFYMPDEEAYQELDKVIEKLKKSYKWNKLLRLCPDLKEYELQRRKLIKQLKQQTSTTPTKQANISPVEITIVNDETPPTPSSTLTSTTDLTVIPPKELTKTPSKEVAINPAKAVATTPTKELNTLASKEIVTPMAKLLAEQQNKAPEKEDEYRKMTYEEICNLIQELWAKGRLGEKEQLLLVRQDVKIIKEGIQQQVLSLRKKIWLFNYIANIFRQRILFEEAIFLLRSALVLDDEDPVLLKNLGYTLIANGEVDVAQSILEDAQQLGDIHHQTMDYTVLDLLKQ